MKPFRIVRAVLLAATVVSTVGCDQATKHIARMHLAGSAPLSFLGGSVHLTLTQNEGGFLSLGSSLPPGLRSTVFQLSVAGGLLVAAVYLVRIANLRFSGLLCAWLLWAGGLSNLLDRVLFEGHVTDFMIVGLGPLRTGVFNVADIAIMAGGVFFVLALRGSRTQSTA
jgi:signal peptidase II